MARLFRPLAVAAQIALVLAVSLVCVSPALAEVPLENPDTARAVYSGVALLSYYSGTLDLVIAESPGEVGASLKKVPFANIPPGLEGATQEFSLSTTGVVDDLVYVSAGVDSLTDLLAQTRPDEALALADNLTATLAQARTDLAQMEQAIEAHGQVFRVDSVAADSDLRLAYDQVLERIARVRQMLAIYDGVVEDVLRPDPGTGTWISLQLDPGTAFVGDEITFQGRLMAANGRPLAGRKVQILLDGAPSATVTTGPGGLYLGSLRVPYWYVDQITVRALYDPAGGDEGVYRASLSPDVVLQVLFYDATLTIEPAGPAHPGLKTRIVATFDYGESLIASERRVEIYLDNDLAASLPARPNVDCVITMPADIGLGRHMVTVSAQSMGRYAPVVATAELVVTTVAYAIELDTPAMLWAPWGAQVSGVVGTQWGPVDGAYVSAGLRGHESRTASAGDGAFETLVETGWGLDLFGTGQVQVRVDPQQPWYGPVTVTKSVYVVNVFNCSLLLLVVVLLAVYVPRRLKGRLGVIVWPSGQRLPWRPAGEPEAACGQEAAAPSEAAPAPAEPAGTLRERILGWYLLLLTVVQRITRVTPRPNQTLREFMQETGPALGPLSRRFAEATITVEALLYSRREPTEEDVDRTRALSRNLEKGEGGEAG